MATYVNTFFEERREQLFTLAGIVEKIFSSANLEYRIIGGLATYLYVEEVAPDAGRLTKDVDVAVRREDLLRIARAAQTFGFEHRHVSGIDTLHPVGETFARRAVHLVFADNLRPAQVLRGLKLIPVADLVRMKLTSFRAKDEAHLVDLDEAGLITAEVEAGLSQELRERLKQTRQRNA